MTNKQPFFDHAIPEKAPQYVDYRATKLVEATFKSIRERMDKLETALDKSGLRGEVFSAAIRPLMGNYTEPPALDGMTADEIATMAKAVARGLNENDIPVREEWKNAFTVVDIAFITTPEWEIVRSLGLGGSDSPNVVNMGYTSSQVVYMQKAMMPEIKEEIDSDKQFIFDFGHKVEPLVIDQFCRKSGAVRVPETRMLANKEYPFMIADIDAIVKFPDGRMFVFEAKTTSQWNDGDWLNGGIPRQYVPQCRKYQIVLNDDRILGTYIGCIYGNHAADWHCSFLPRNKALEDAQIKTEKAFWENYVLGCEMPPKSGMPGKDLVVVNALSQTDPTAPDVKFDDDTGELLEKYLELKSEKDLLAEKSKLIETQMDGIKVDILEALGESTTGKYDCPAELAPDDNNYEIVAKYGASKKTTCDYDRLQLKYPDAYNDCVTVDPMGTRRFSVSLKKKKK